MKASILPPTRARRAQPAVDEARSARPDPRTPPTPHPWQGIVASLNGDSGVPSAIGQVSHRQHLMLPGRASASDPERPPTPTEQFVLGLVAERPVSAPELAAAMAVDMRTACSRIARMRARGLIERTARGWQAVDITARAG